MVAVIRLFFCFELLLINEVGDILIGSVFFSFPNTHRNLDTQIVLSKSKNTCRRNETVVWKCSSRKARRLMHTVMLNDNNVRTCVIHTSLLNTKLM